jgi:hypothetical protein
MGESPNQLVGDFPMRIQNFRFVNFRELVKELNSSRFQVEKVLKSPLVREGIHYYHSTPYMRYWNVELIRDLFLNRHSPEQHQLAIDEFKAQTHIQKGIPSVVEDKPHVA